MRHWSIILFARRLIRLLKTPIDLGLHENMPDVLRRLDSLAKPTACYEQLLFLFIMMSFVVYEIFILLSCWDGVKWIMFAFTATLFVVSCMNMLIPPRFSMNRLFFIYLCLIFFFIIFSPHYCRN